MTTHKDTTLAAFADGLDTGDRTARTVAAACWRVSTTDSTATFAVRELGAFRVRGTIPIVAGAVWVDSTGAVSAVGGELDPAGVATGSARRDKDLRSRKFFDVANRDRWTFTADQVDRTARGWTVRGTFTARTTCRLDLDVAQQSTGSGSRYVTATATLDRREAGIRAPRFLVGRKVHVELRLGLVPGVPREAAPTGVGTGSAP